MAKELNEQPQENQADRNQNIRPVDDDFPLLHHVINRIITTLQYIIIPPVFLIVILSFTYFVALIISLFLNPTQSPDAPRSPAIEELNRALIGLLNQFSPLLEKFATSIWSFLAPILTLIFIIVVLRWLLFSRRYALGQKLGRLAKDVPSLIAIIVLVTICLLPIVGSGIPDVLSNIALVIIGFYFGNERRLRSEQRDETEDKTSGQQSS